MAVNISGGSEGELFISAGLDISSFERENQKLQKQMQSTTTVAKDQAAAMESLGKKVTAALGAFAALNFGSQFVKDIARVRGEMQALEVAFEVMLHSKAEADKLLAKVAQFAATTPFGLPEVANATKQLLAFGISADKVEGTLRSLGDIAAGLGQPLGEIAYLYGTIKTAGTANAVDLKQFAQRGIPIYTELAKVLKVNQERIDDMVSAGKVGFPEIEKAFKGMTEKGSQFGGLMEAQSKTIIGLQANLQDAIDQMLNQFGKSTEGVIADVIKGATFLVENYQKVIDVLKSAVLVYGTYRTAILLSTAATEGQTIAEVLRAKAITLSNRAMTLLNATMLKNPFVLTATLVGALAAKFIFLNDTLDESKLRTEEYSSELKKERDALTGLFDKVEKSAEGTIERKNAIAEINKQYGTYLPKLLSELSTNQDLATAYEKLNKKIEENIALKFKSKSADKLQKQFGETNDELFDKIFSKIKENVGAKEAGEATQAFNVLIEQLEKLEQAQLNVKKGLEKGSVADLYTREFTLIQEFARKYKLINFEDVQKFAQNNVRLKEGMKEIDDFYNGLISHTEEANKNAQKTLDDYLKQNNFLQVLDKALSLATTKGSLELIKKKLEEDKNALDTRTQQKDIDRYLGKIQEVDALISKYDQKKTSSVDRAENKLLNERKSILEDIVALKRDAAQSAMTSEQSALDKVNEKYELIEKKIIEVNKQVDDFNRKNPNAQIPKIGQNEIIALNKAKEIELSSEADSKITENFKKALTDRKEMYAQYESTKKEIGSVAAKELFLTETAEYDSYIKFLEGKAKEIAGKINEGIATGGDKERLEFIKQELDDANKGKLAANKQYLGEILKQTVTFKQQEQAINERYDAMISVLSKQKNAKDFDENIQILEKQRQQELQGVKDNAERQKEVYATLNQDILLLSESRIQEEIAKLQEFINEVDLPPALRQALIELLDKLKQLKRETKVDPNLQKFSQEFSKAATYIQQTSGALYDLGNSVEEFSPKIAGIIRQLVLMSDVSVQATNAFINFAKGGAEGIAGGIASAINVIANLVGGIARDKAERRRQEQEIKDFQDQIYKGEQEINILYRERAREQIRINTLRVQGLEEEKTLLLQQADEVKKQYEKVFSDLQHSTGEMLVQERRGFEIENVTKQFSLMGKTLQEIEDLSIKGLLSDEAEGMFQLAKKLQDEMNEIAQAQKENTAETLEVLTGTTADSITDSIVEGFRNGKTSAEDFADSFEDLMRGAMLNSIKFEVIKPLADKFVEQFADFAKSNNEIDQDEERQLNDMWDNIIKAANERAEQLEKITGVSLVKTDSEINSLSGSIQRELTEKTGTVIAGQFSGLRLTAIEHLKVANQSLNAITQISNYTFRLIQIQKDIADINSRGIKIR